MMRKIVKFLLCFALVCIGSLSAAFAIGANTPTAYADNASDVAAAKAAGKYHTLDIGFAMPYQNTGWGMSTSDALVGLYIKGAENVSFKTGDYDISAKGYVYVSDDVNSEGADKGNGVYGFTNKGSNGWAFINLNLGGKRYKRVTLKSGLIIKAGTDKDEVYELTEDYVLYDVNNTYIGGKTIEEALEKAGDMVTYYDRKISSVTKDSGSVTIKYDSTLEDLVAVGAPASVSFEKIVGENGGTWQTFGGYFNTTTKQEVFHNNLAAFTIAENEKVIIKSGFLTCFWAESNTKIYVVRTTEDFYAKYSGGKFVALGDNEKAVAIAKAAGKYHVMDIGFAMPYQNTGWGMKTSDALVGLYIKGAESVSFKTGDYDISAKGYVSVSNDVNSEGSDKGSGVYGFTNRGGNGWAFINLNLGNTRYKRVTLKSGLIIKAGTNKEEVYELTEDYVLYDVNNTYIGGKTIEEALEKAGDMVNYIDREISSITKNDSSITIKYNSLVGNFGGAPASVSFEKIVGSNGGTWQTFGGYNDTTSQQQVTHNIISFTVAENEIVTVKAGFKTCFWAESNTKIYVIRTTEDAAFRYTDGKFVAAKATVTIDGSISTEVNYGESFTVPKLSDTENKTFLYLTDSANNVYFAGDEIENVTADLALTAVYADFAMQDGAAIRISSDIASSGIRFSADIAKGMANIKGVGILVIPQDMLSGELTKASVVSEAAKSALDFYWAYSDVDFGTADTAVLRATITTVRQTNYNRTFVARAYVVVENGESEKVVYADLKDSNERTVYYVAKAAYDKESELNASQKLIAKGYIDSVLAIETVDGGYTAVTGNVTNVSVAYENNSATITATTTVNEFYGLQLNGVNYSYKELEQSYADGILTIKVAVLKNFSFGTGEVIYETRGSNDSTTTGTTVAELSDKMGSEVQRVWISCRKLCYRDSASNKLFFDLAQVEAYKNYFAKLKANGTDKIIAMSNEYLLPYGYNPWSAYANNGNVVPYGGDTYYEAWLGLIYEYYYQLATLFPEISYFEVGNEVDFSVYYENAGEKTYVYIKANGDGINSDGAAKITADVMFRATKAIKKVNAANKVLFPGLAAGDTAQITSAKAFLTKVYNVISKSEVDNGAYEYSTNFNDYFEILAVHPYPYKDGNTEQWVRDLNSIYNLCATTRGHKVRVWLTEFGIPYDGGNTASSWTTEQLNTNLTKFLDEMNKLDYIDAVVWFRLCDLYEKDWNERENIMGLFYSKSDPVNNGAAKVTAKVVYKWLYGKEM